MTQKKLVFDCLKNIGSKKIPLKYNTRPETLVHMYVSQKSLPEESNILLPYLLLDDYEIFANLLKKGTVLFEGLKIPMKDVENQKKNRMRYLEVPPNNKDSVIWLNNFNLCDLDLADKPKFEKVPFETEKDNLLFPDLKAPVEIQTQIGNFFTNKLECTIDDYKKLAQELCLDINSKHFETILNEIILQSKPESLGNLFNFIDSEIFISQNTVSEFYSSFILNVCFFKLFSVMNDKFIIAPKTLNALNALLDKVSSTIPEGFSGMKSQILFQLFDYYTKIGDLKNAKKLLNLFIEKTRKLPSDTVFLNYMKQAAQSSNFNDFVGGLQTILPQYLCKDLVGIFLNKVKYYTELQFILNFVDAHKPSLYKACANEILNSVFNIRDGQRSTYTRNTAYMKLMDVLFRLQKRGVVEEDFSSDIKNHIFSYLISRNEYRDIYIHIKGFQVKESEFLGSVITKLELQSYSNDGKQQLLSILKEML